MKKKPIYPKIPIKMVIPYPDDLDGRCPVCKSIVEFNYNSSEKTIYKLSQLIVVRYHLVSCTNKACEMKKHPFNPTPRFDYSKRSYGKDVLEKIGEYSLKDGSKAIQIHSILKREYALPISESTVSRMMDDILVLTSFNIDKNTKNIIEKQESILIALDGQEPDGDHPALWNFVDVISNRVLKTQYLESADHNTLHGIIEEIKKKYKTPIIGFISDKQGSIRVCMEKYYSGIPHQYCTYHFSTNLWNHLAKYANVIQRDLQKTVKSLYITTVSKETTIFVPAKNKKVSLRELCDPLSKELKRLVKKRNEKFKQIKGILSYSALAKYLEGFQESVAKIPINDRFAKIMKKTIQKLSDVLKRNRSAYENAKEGFEFFKAIHKHLWKDIIQREMKIMQLNNVFGDIWLRCVKINSSYSKKSRKSFLPASNTPYWKILGEWTRLWDSYKPGLFKYYEFPKEFKSNVDMEQKFSTETQRFRSQSGRSHVGQIISSRGEYVIRLQYANEKDLDFEDILSDSQAHLQYLITELHEKIHDTSKRMLNKLTIEQIYNEILKWMYRFDETKTEGELH